MKLVRIRSLAALVRQEHDGPDFDEWVLSLRLAQLEDIQVSPIIASVRWSIFEGGPWS